jgi:hypothetical protein
MVQILSRLKFPTESYGCFSGHGSVETAAI